MSSPPRAPERRRNGTPEPPNPWLESHGPPDEPRWLGYIGPLFVTSTLLIALGIWKAIELVSRAL